MRNFKDSYKGQAKVKTRKNRVDIETSIIYYAYCHKCKQDPDFMSEDREFNIDAELAADFEAKLA